MEELFLNDIIIWLLSHESRWHRTHVKLGA